MVNAGATLSTLNTNALSRDGSAAAIILDGGTLNHAGGNHAHIGNITLKNGAIWQATSGGSYDTENAQLDGTVTVAGTSASTIGPFTAGIGLNGDREFNVADVTGDAGVDLTVSGELENNGSGAGDGIIKTGAGTMHLTTNATYTGNTVINGGTFAMSASLNNASEVHINTGATLELRATNKFLRTSTSAAVIIDGGTLTMIAGGPNHNKFGNMTLNNGAVWTTAAGTNAWDGENFVIRPGSTITVGGTSASTMSAEDGVNIGEASGIVTFDVADVTGDSGADLLVNTELEQGGSLIKTGAGTMEIQKRSTYTGGTTVNAGTLEITGGGNSSTGAIRGTLAINDGGRVDLNAPDALGYGSGADSISAININDTGVLHRIGGANETLGSVAITMDGGTISADLASQHYDLFGGGTTVTVNNAGAIAGRESVISAQLDLRQTDSLFIVNENGVLRVNTLGDDGGATLTKAGVGTMIIDGDNAYAAATNINAGTLELNGAHTGAGACTVAGGATLSGTGSTSAAVTADGTIAPGNSPGALTVGSLDLNGSLAYEIDGAASDLLVVTGALDITGATLAITDLGGGWTEEAYVIAQYGSLTGTFSGGVTGLDAGYHVEYDYNGGTEIAAVVPEPATMSLLTLGAVVMMRRRRK